MVCWSFCNVWWTPPRLPVLMRYPPDCWRASQQNSRQSTLKSSVYQCPQACYQSLGTRPGNYRPVSLTCILCKTLEHIFCMHKSEAISTGSGSSLQPTMAFEPNTRVRRNCWWPLITFYDIGTLGSKWISPFSTSVRLWYCPPPKAAR